MLNFAEAANAHAVIADIDEEMAAFGIVHVFEFMSVHDPQRMRRADTDTFWTLRTESAEVAFHCDCSHTYVPNQQRIQPGSMDRLVDDEAADPGYWRT